MSPGLGLGTWMDGEPSPEGKEAIGGKEKDGVAVETCLLQPCDFLDA